jgi:hypothetical protein
MCCGAAPEEDDGKRAFAATLGIPARTAMEMSERRHFKEHFNFFSQLVLTHFLPKMYNMAP